MQGVLGCTDAQPAITLGTFLVSFLENLPYPFNWVGLSILMLLCCCACGMCCYAYRRVKSWLPKRGGGSKKKKRT